MRKVTASLGVGVLATTAVLAAAPPAAAAGSGRAPACNAIDAPKAMNELPASDDCPSSSASGGGAAAAQVAPTTLINASPLSFDRTNGDILAITKIAGTNDLAFGGNFTLVYTPDRVSHAATNFAVVDESSGAVLYGGQPTNSVNPSDNYVRAITSFGGVIYVGGDFDGWAGVARSHAVALSSTYAVTSWNPAPSQDIRAMATDGSAVYMGGDLGAVKAFNTTTGALLWSKPTTHGGVHALFLNAGFLFAGGLFGTYDGVTQQGLVKITLSNGSMVTAFNANLRPNSFNGQYGAYDGENVLAIAAGPTSDDIIIGIGGHAPPGLSSNETKVVSATTGALVWRFGTKGDSQAVGLVGDTVVAGYHNNVDSNPLTPQYFATQLEYSNGAQTTWDPQINGNQSNADGGNNGVQAIYVDQGSDTLYLAGAFLHWDGTTGLTHASLIAFTFTPPGGGGTLFTNNAEGGTPGATVTTANSGGASGNAFTVVARGAGATLIYSSTAAAHGTLGYSLAGSSGTSTAVGWSGLSATSIAARFYYNPGTVAPAALIRLLDIRNPSGTAARIELATTNQLFVQNNAGVTVDTFPTPVKPNTWYRVEIAISISASAATIDCAYYLDDGTTPVDAAYATTAGNTGTASVAQVSFGSAATATWTGTSYFDDLAVQTGTTSFIGPA
jgi:hypothetical protein